MKTYKWSDKSYDLITRDDKIVIPASLERPAVEWYHEHLLHPGASRLELTLRQHYTFIGLKTRVEQVSKACMTCKSLKKSHLKYRKVPVKTNPEWIPWHTLCIDLIGPYQFGKVNKEDKSKDTSVSLHLSLIHI